MSISNYAKLYTFALGKVKININKAERIALIKDIRFKIEGENLKNARKIVDRAIYELRVRRAMEILESQETYPAGVRMIRDEFGWFLGNYELGIAIPFAKAAKKRLDVA